MARESTVVVSVSKPAPEAEGHRAPLAGSERGLVAEMVAQARRLQARGDWDEAGAKLRLAVSLAPDNPVAHEALGLHEAKRGRFREAVETLARAVELGPDSGSAQNNLGAVAAQAGAFDRAVAAFTAAVRLRPDWIEARLNLGLACLQSDRFAEAAEVYRAAEAATPGRSDVAYRLSLALSRLGQLDEAEFEARRAIDRSADSAEVYRHHGNVLRRLGRPDEAVRALRAALDLQPGDPTLLGDYAIALHEAGRPHDAIRVFGEVVSAVPGSPDHRSNLGVALAEVGYLAEAAECYAKAVELNPNSAEAHNNLAVSLVQLGRLDEAMGHYDRAIAIKPGYADARANRARALLAAGRFEEGWREYEWRRGDRGRPRRGCPEWDGRPLPAGSRLLLSAEQGFGDTIQFVRLAALAGARSRAAVVFECPPPLRPLLDGVPGVDGVALPGGPLPGCAARAPLMSLPALLGLTEADLPAGAPYLRPDPGRAAFWKERVAELTPGARLRVGIVWQGNPRFKADRNRSIPLAHLGPLASVPGVRLVSVQKEHGAEQVEKFPSLAVASLGPELDRDAPFLDTLAVLASLELVVTADTALAHLAGAAGVEAWVALPFAADWRWGRGRDDSPWYPTARLFRQPKAGDWVTVFERVADALAARLGVARVAAPDLVGDAVRGLARRASEAKTAGQHDESARLLREALRLRPDDPELTHDLALALARKKDRYEAELCFRRCLVLRPAFPEACNNLGILLEETGRAAEACECFRRSLAHKPNSVETHSNLGVALAARGEYEQAVVSYHESIRLKPDNPAAFNNLGNSLRNLGLPAQAVAALDTAIAQSEDYAEAHNNKGIALVLLGRVDEALACYGRALELKPDYAEAHLNRALSLLGTGRYEEGWREYEWRWRCNGFGPRTLPGRPWDGGEVRGGPLLLYVEQGLGDTVQFARLVPLVKKRASAPVVLECQPALIPLMRSFPGLDRIVPAGHPLPACAAHAPLLSLPGLLKLTDADLPAARVPYLHAEPERVGRWRERVNRLTEGARLRVGIGWQGNPRFKADRFRSIPLVHFGPLTAVPGVHFVSLQKGAGEEQLAEWGERFGVAKFGPDVDRDGAFLDTLAILASLDLVITSDTALAHLAGAAGVETWLVIPAAADWRWGKGRQDCPWYPTMRVFRQPRLGDWAAPFRQVADELALRAKGVAAGARNFVAEAVAALGRRGSAEIRAGRNEAGAELLKQALRLQPDNPDLLHNVGVAWAKQGVLPVAQVYFTEAVRARPESPETHNNLGLSYLQQNRLTEAEACFRATLRTSPDHVDALNHLGVVFANQDRWVEAAEWYRAAVRVRPDSAEAHNNLGNALRSLDRPEEAVEHLQKATELSPDNAEMWNNLGIGLGQLGRTAEAAGCFERALGLDPDHADAVNNLGVTRADLGQVDEGVACLEKAVHARPDFPEAHKNLGLVRLIRGDLRGGWREYEWRWRCKGNAPRSLPAPAWDGREVRGGPLLLYAEQGLGDTIQFARLAAAASARARAPVVLECQPPLVALMRNFPGVERVVAAGDPLPPVAAHAALLSVPGLLDLAEPGLPGIGFPYLLPEPERAAAWKERLDELMPRPGLRVGIAWQGNPKYAGDRSRSVPLVYFTALHRLAGVQLLSLQKGHGAEQLDRLPPWFPVVRPEPELDRDGAFLDTLAVLASLDLVITSDTALTHLAGAAGVETWVALPFAADWRWERGRDDTPWYPSLRLFRQPAIGAWAGVFERITRELEARAGGGVTAEIPHGELFDKITILEIKAERIADEAKRANVRRELAALLRRRPPTPPGAELAALLGRLKGVNERLWVVEDELRDCERGGEFGDRFVRLARSVYHLNDERAAIKREVNLLSRSPLVEEKSYAAYPGGPAVG